MAILIAVVIYLSFSVKECWYLKTNLIIFIMIIFEDTHG